MFLCAPVLECLGAFSKSTFTSDLGSIPPVAGVPRLSQPASVSLSVWASTAVKVWTLSVTLTWKALPVNTGSCYCLLKPLWALSTEFGCLAQGVQDLGAGPYILWSWCWMYHLEVSFLATIAAVKRRWTNLLKLKISSSLDEERFRNLQALPWDLTEMCFNSLSNTSDTNIIFHGNLTSNKK